ncbi:MAG: AAA family ATPase [Clostridia bacterium]|nr:AAA family ATPase [Clostridia bacterium]
MLLTSLKLKDFRQFKGVQPIEFATGSDKNVTIILGENGSGKTSLAQAFTWCLYGKTDFEDTLLLCKATAQAMLPGDEETVEAELKLTHSGTDYTITSKQRYKKNSAGVVQSVGQRKFAIAFKGKDGQQEFVPDLQTDLRMKEILPSELSKYFFFDGERIGNMSKELRRGKSSEFADAVRSLLGLSAFTAALYHLKGSGTSRSVIRSYDEKYDSTSDKRIADYTQRIAQFNEEIEKIDERLLEIEREEELVAEKTQALNDSIKENETSRDLASRKVKLVERRQTLNNRRKTQTVDLLKAFNKNAPAYFAKKMMGDSLGLLTQTQNLDKGFPDIHARTIDHIIKNGKCICGAEVCIGNDAFNALNKLRDYIPPKSLGQLIETFRLTCESSVKGTESFFDDFCDKYRDILSFDFDYAANESEIDDITKRLTGMKDVGQLQAELTKYERQQRNLRDERSQLDVSKGGKETNRDRMETERHELTLKDKNNQCIEIFKAYAQYLRDTIAIEYNKEERRVRDELSMAVGEIFREIYNGGLSLSLDEKYNVQVMVSDFGGYTEDIETSTAQSISIIFAFIAGVIKMARESQQPENAMLVSEPYPLVMDAPLSAFDKTRIQTVCNVLPNVAEQVIIFIKDTDGELAEKYLSDRIGSRAEFDKHNEFETYIRERG